MNFKYILNENNNLALTIGAALVLATIIGGIFYTTKGNGADVMTVTGSARKEVVADTVLWRTNITRNVGFNDLKLGYAKVASDLALVKEFLKTN